MADPGTSSRHLDTWSEIAAYLNVSIRTAQKYERVDGMPVRRMPGEKGRVWAYPEELDAWKSRMSWVSDLDRGNSATANTPARSDEPRSGSEQLKGRHAADPQTSRMSDGFPRWAKITGIGVVLASIIGIAGYRFVWLGGEPAGVRVEDKQIVVTNERGNQLWQHSFPQLLHKPFYSGSEQRWIRFADLDGDGHISTLFNYLPSEHQATGTKLYCFADNGDVRWKFTPGRVVSDQTQQIPSIYHANNLIVVPKSGSQGPWIVTTSNHGWTYSDQVAVLDRNGNLKGEYWHSGHLYLMALWHADRGPSRVLLGGINNGHRRATLVLLDPRRVAGASVEPPGDYRQLRGMKEGTEEVVVLFRRSCVLDKNEEFNRVHTMDVSPAGVSVMVSELGPTAPYVIYQLDRNFRAVSVTVSDTYLRRHRELFSAGLLDHEFSVKEIEQLRQITVIRK